MGTSSTKATGGSPARVVPVVLCGTFLVSLVACVSSDGAAAPTDASEAHLVAARPEVGEAFVADATDDRTLGNGASAPADAGEGGAGIADAAEDSYLDGDAVVACSGPQDCRYPPPGPGPFIACCIDNACVSGQSAIDSDPCADANAQPIQASSYDQSCETDSDCVAVAVGNFCYALGWCKYGTINGGAYAQYQADVARTRAICSDPQLGCAYDPGPCCRSRSCQMGFQCLSDAETGAGDAADGG